MRRRSALTQAEAFVQSPAYVPHMLDLLLPDDFLLSEAPGVGVSHLVYANLTIEHERCWLPAIGTTSVYMSYSTEVRLCTCRPMQDPCMGRLS